MGWGIRKKPVPGAEPARTRLRTLESRRMTMVAANTGLVQADLRDVTLLGMMLDAIVPENWPPDLYDREPMEYALRQLADPAEHGWSFWYLLTSEGGGSEVLGICGFKGRPNAAGSVEIGYSVLSQFRNQGFATEAVERLVTWAFSHQSVVEVCAETLPHLQQSIRVMQKNGFVYTGSGSELGVVRYAVKRPDRR
jgi:RimJ/RimL family protein N-acetyltransferase